MKNKVELLEFAGSDESHAGSAWISTGIEVKDRITEIPRLLNQLMENEHSTPFETSYFRFRVTCEQASHIHLLKHRIGVSINGESARYKELKEDKFYLPEDWKVKDADPIRTLDQRTLDYWIGNLEDYSNITNQLYHNCLEQLTPIIGRKRAKESARYFKIMTSQIQLDVKFNFRSLMHFLELRNSSHAQLEIRKIAKSMLDLVKNIEGNPFQHSIEAFQKQLIVKKEFQEFTKNKKQNNGN